MLPWSQVKWEMDVDLIAKDREGSSKADLFDKRGRSLPFEVRLALSLSAVLEALLGAVQGSPLGAEISVSTSGSVLDASKRLKDCKECIRHFWTLRRVV